MKTKLLALLFLVLDFVIGFVLAIPSNASIEGTYWPHEPYHWGNVQVADHTLPGDHWNVKLAVREWGSGLHYGWCDNPHRNCIRVVAHAQGTKKRYLGTSYRFTYGGSNRMMYGVIVMNRSEVHITSPEYKTQAVTHELGHELGLGHDTTGGVMSPIARGYPINNYERRELQKIYLNNEEQAMTTKKQRREAVAEKRATYDAETKRMGLAAQKADRQRRAKRLEDLGMIESSKKQAIKMRASLRLDELANS